MMMTVKETPIETRVSVYNERSAKSTGRIKGKQPGERSPQSISRTKSKVRDIVACNEFDLAVTLEINPRKVPISKQEDTLQEIIDYLKNIKRTHKDFCWLLVPEKYPSGKRLQLHGLLKNLILILMHARLLLTTNLMKVLSYLIGEKRLMKKL